MDETCDECGEAFDMDELTLTRIHGKLCVNCLGRLGESDEPEELDLELEDEEDE